LDIKNVLLDIIQFISAERLHGLISGLLFTLFQKTFISVDAINVKLNPVN